jgi:phosphoglycolate phosphatase
MAKFKFLVFDWNGTLYDADVIHVSRLDRLYPGTEEVLASLKQAGYLMAIATAASQRSLLRQLVALNIDHYFIAWATGDVMPGKPHPEAMEYLLNIAQVAPSETLMIGDTENDMLFAKASGTQALAVTYGLSSKEQLLKHQPLGYIDNIQDLPKWLQNPGSESM